MSNQSAHLNRRAQPVSSGHGMMWGTSLVKAINPAWVDVSRVDAIKASPLSHPLKDQPASKLEALKQANAALGNRFLDLAAERLTQLARDSMGTRPSDLLRAARAGQPKNSEEGK
jgi:hypothetical protein